MFEIIHQSGPWGVILSALTLLNLGLAGWCLISLLSSDRKLGPALKNRINAVLFWGAIGALVGLLGQANGVYLALRAVSRATDISPPVVMEGFAISFFPTIIGLLLLLGSALAWMVLKSLHARRLPA